MRAMGRKPTKNNNLPPRMRARSKPGGIYYYYDTGGKPRKEIPLGKDYIAAVRQWAELEGDKTSITSIITFKDAADNYLRKVLPTKAARTQTDNLVELEWLLKFFNNPPAPLANIEPIHIRQYMNWRVEQSAQMLAAKNAKRAAEKQPLLQVTGKEGQVRANREKALFSHIWNTARETGLTSLPNPCSGIKGFSETGRDNYTEDDVLLAVWEAGDQALRDAIDLAYLSAQRPADVLEMSDLNIKDNILAVEQNKTGKKLRLEIIGELKVLIDAMAARKKNHKVHTLALICTETGRPLTYAGLRSRFDKARIKAAKTNPHLKDAIEAFQFRDLRAKAATDKAESGSMHQAQKQLGHSTIVMTEHYVRNRRGATSTPTK